MKQPETSLNFGRTAETTRTKVGHHNGAREDFRFSNRLYKHGSSITVLVPIMCFLPVINYFCLKP